MADHVGHQLGNYRLIRLLGKGGFAEVYLGEHQYLKTPAAIKLLRTKVANEADLQDFLKEARTVAQLVHPHIVRILEFGMDGETPFLVMDYANGTLRQRHPKGSQLPLTTIIPYVKHIAEALQYAHEEKFIHRDVKPENMLVGRRDTILLSDFGIALIAQSTLFQSIQEVIGTVSYMSPEQIQGKARPASDQYSLGVVVYEWLSGECPFHGSFTELCIQHMFASPPPLHEKLPTIPLEVEEVVMTALNKDPKQRFESVQAFASALEQVAYTTQLTQLKPTLQSLAPQLSADAQIDQLPANPLLVQSPLITLSTSQHPIQPSLPPAIAITKQTIVQTERAIGIETPLASRAKKPIISRRTAIITGATIGTILVASSVIGYSVLLPKYNIVLSRATPSFHPTPKTSLTLTSTETTTNKLPTASSFLQSNGTVSIGMSLKYPSNWAEDAVQASASSSYIRLHPQQTQYGIVFVLERFSATTSTSFSGPDDLNNQLLQSISTAQGVHNLQKLQTSTPKPNIGGAQWTEQDTSYTDDNGSKIRLNTISVEHNKLYYNILIISPDLYYNEAMQKYIQPMFDSMQFL